VLITRPVAFSTSGLLIKPFTRLQRCAAHHQTQARSGISRRPSVPPGTELPSAGGSSRAGDRSWRGWHAWAPVARALSAIAW